MNRFAFVRLGRTLLLAAVVAVGSVCWLGCGGDDGGGDDNGGNTNNSGNNNGNKTHTHDWGDWIVTTPATCDAEGVETRTCKLDASHKDTRAVQKLTGTACNSGGQVVRPETVVKSTFTDSRDGKTYKTVKIGSQTWMAENLNYELVGNSRCYGDKQDSCAKYGRLYNWNAANMSCPSEWHLPDQDEWIMLTTSVGGGSTGMTLKSTTWGTNERDRGSDTYGFSALPGGHYNYSDGKFYGAGSFAYFWSATETADGKAHYRYLETYIIAGGDKLFADANEKYDAFSVRCVKDDNNNGGGKEPNVVDPSTVVKGTFTDSRDGNTYKTVKIGKQTWMAENLNYDTADGNLSWCYKDSPDSCAKYGRFYQWKAAKTACPSGYHLPTRDEWGTLAKAAGGSGTYGEGGTAGTKLKSNSGWSGDGNGTDDYGFSALPGGNGVADGSSSSNAGYEGRWWTVTERGSSNNAYYRRMYFYYDYVLEGDDIKGYGYSVRCVAD